MMRVAWNERRVRYARAMRRIALLVVAGCGSSAQPAATTMPSNQATEPPHVQIEDEQVPTFNPNDAQLARQQAIEQARQAGVLGSAAGGSAAPPVTALDKQAIRTAVHPHLAEITYCYERELGAKPTLHGTTRVEFSVDPNGVVIQATGSGFDPAVDACVADVVKSIKFPASNGGVTTVGYPFVFHQAQ